VLSIQRIIEIAASAGTHFSRESSDQSQPRPLAEAERSQELLLGVAKRGIDGISRRDWQARTSVLRIPRRTESTAKMLRDQSSFSQSGSALIAQSPQELRSYPAYRDFVRNYGI
jgi:hypothetical protein